jgi:hypothetical protein
VHLTASRYLDKFRSFVKTRDVDGVVERGALDVVIDGGFEPGPPVNHAVDNTRKSDFNTQLTCRNVLSLRFCRCPGWWEVASALLYVPKMSAARSPTGLPRLSCVRSMRWVGGSPASRWSPRLRKCWSRQHRGFVVLGAEAPKLNPDDFVSLSAPVSPDSGGLIRSGSRELRNGPSCLRHDGGL